MLRAALVLLALLAAPALGAPRWDPVPPDPGESGHEHVIHFLLDAAAAGADDQARVAWRRDDRLVRTLCRSVERWTYTSGGSWNHGPNACAAWVALDDDVEPERILEGYAAAQTTGPPAGHGLMGRETLSHRYLDTTLVALELAADRAKRPATRAALYRLLRAHAYALALFAVEGGPSGERLSIVAPGARSKTGTTSAQWLSRWLAGAIYGPERPTIGWNRQWAWPLRATWALGQKPWLSPADRALLARHVATGGEAEAIVATLRDVGAAFVVDAEVLRTSTGIAAWMARNPNGNSAPLMGASWTGGQLHALHLHPPPEDSGGPRSLGACRADLVVREVAASCVGAVGFGRPPPAGVRFDPAISTYSAAIPLPPGMVVYHARIGPAGAELLGAAPVPKPVPEEPPAVSLTDLEIAKRIVAAWLDPQPRLEDVPAARDPERVGRLIDYLRRIE